MFNVLTLQAIASTGMFGLIWMVQVVHYPLLAAVGDEAFARYHTRHVRRMTFVVAPLMLTELVTSAWLICWPRDDVPLELAWIGFGLTAAVWLLTGLVSVPLHHKLEQGFDARAHARLVRTNWLRTAAWTARVVVVFAMLATWGD